MDVTLLKVENPGRFWLTCSSPSLPDRRLEVYSELKKRMTTYYSQLSTNSARVPSPVVGQIYAVYGSGGYERMIVTKITEGQHMRNARACCESIDNLTSVTVDCAKLCQLMPEFSIEHIPAKPWLCHLYAVKSTGLTEVYNTITGMIEVNPTHSSKWIPAATTFLGKEIKRGVIGHAVEELEGSHGMVLYYKGAQEDCSRSLNDVLASKDFAMLDIDTIREVAQSTGQQISTIGQIPYLLSNRETSLDERGSSIPALSAMSALSKTTPKSAASITQSMLSYTPSSQSSYGGSPASSPLVGLAEPKTTPVEYEPTTTVPFPVGLSTPGVGRGARLLSVLQNSSLGNRSSDGRNSSVKISQRASTETGVPKQPIGGSTHAVSIVESSPTSPHNSPVGTHPSGEFRTVISATDRNAALVAEALQTRPVEKRVSGHAVMNQAHTHSYPNPMVESPDNSRSIATISEAGSTQPAPSQHCDVDRSLSQPKGLSYATVSCMETEPPVSTVNLQPTTSEPKPAFSLQTLLDTVKKASSERCEYSSVPDCILDSALQHSETLSTEHSGYAPVRLASNGEVQNSTTNVDSANTGQNLSWVDATLPELISCSVVSLEPHDYRQSPFLSNPHSSVSASTNEQTNGSTSVLMPDQINHGERLDIATPVVNDEIPERSREDGVAKPIDTLQDRSFPLNNTGKSQETFLPKCEEAAFGLGGTPEIDNQVSGKQLEDYHSQEVSKLVQVKDKQISPFPKENFHSKAQQDVWYEGTEIPVPVQEFSTLPFHRAMTYYWEKRKLTMDKIHQFTWPAVYRGTTLVTVYENHQVFQARLAYLVPLLSNMMTGTKYQDIDPGMGPLVLIISSSWQEVCDLGHMVEDMLTDLNKKSHYLRQIKAHYLYGNQEDDMAIKLMEGCSVLITSPDCCLRALEKKYTNLSRLCHLVFDDGDRLTTHFYDAVSTIAEKFLRASKVRDAGAAPQQTLLFSTQWTESVKRFSKECMQPGMTLFTSKFEASVRMGQTQVLSFCKPSQSLTKLVEILRLHTDKSLKTIVFAENPADVTSIYKFLLGKASTCIAVHSGLSESELKRAKREWQMMSPPPILIVEDDMLRRRFPLSDAERLIHHGLPRAKGAFGERLHSLSASYKNLSSSRTGSSVCSSHIIFPQDHRHNALAGRLAKFLRRINQPVPPELLDMEKSVKGDTLETLCPSLKSFGICRSENKCKYRHVILQRDEPLAGLPLNGYIKMKVCHVADATTLYCSILSHRDPQTGYIQKYENRRLLDIALDLQIHMADPLNQHYCYPEDVAVGRQYVHQNEQGHFSRVSVIHIPDRKEVFPDNVQVLFVDSGKTMQTVTSALLATPDSFKNIPPQVVEMQIARVQPLDLDTCWTPEAYNHTCSLVDQETIEAVVVLCLGCTVWIDNVVKREQLPTLKTLVQRFDVRKELLNAHHARENPEHLTALRDMCEGVLNLPLATTLPGPISSKTEDRLVSVLNHAAEDLLPDQSYDVYVAEVESPSRFYVQLVSSYEELMDMESEIESIPLASLVHPQVPLANTVYLVESPRYHSMHRGVIVSECGGAYRVILFDYGDIATVTEACIFEAESKYCKLPCQAIECRLASVLPHIEDIRDMDTADMSKLWSPAASDSFYDWTRGVNVALSADSQSAYNSDSQYEDVDGSLKLSLKVVGQSSSLHIGRYSYSVNLRMLNGNSTASRTLVNHGFAIEKKQLVEERLPGLLEDNEEYNYGYMKIPALCNKFSHYKSSADRLFLAEYIYELVVQWINCRDDMRSIGVIKGLCNCLWITSTEPSVQAQILQALNKLCVNHTYNITTALMERGVEYLRSSLMKGRLSGEPVLSVLSSLVSLARQSDVFKDLQEAGFIEFLVEEFPRVNDIRIKVLIVKLLQSFVKIESKCFSMVCTEGFIKSVSEHLLTMAPEEIACEGSDKHVLVMTLCQFMNGLVTDKTSRALAQDLCIQEKVPQRLCKLFFRLNEDKPLVMVAVVDTLSTLILKNPAVKETLIENNMGEKLLRLREAGNLSNVLSKSVVTLLGRMGIVIERKVEPVPDNQLRAPKRRAKEKLQLKPITSCQSISSQQGYQSASPSVLWWQDKRYLLLDVIVRGLEEELQWSLSSPPQQLLSFRILTKEGKEYRFELGPFFGNLDEEKCVSYFTPSKIMFGLKKETKSSWRRLYPVGEKLPYFVKTNFDRLSLSSDDEAEAEDGADSDDEVDKDVRQLFFPENQNVELYGNLVSDEVLARPGPQNGIPEESSDEEWTEEEFDDLPQSSSARFNEDKFASRDAGQLVQQPGAASFELMGGELG